MEKFEIVLSPEEKALILSRITVCGCLEGIEQSKDGKITLTEIEFEELLDAILDILENSNEDEEQLGELFDRLEEIFGE
jgi:hypothetical protein